MQKSLRRWATRSRKSQDLFDRLYEVQKGLCAICKRISHRALCADHCHETGKYRELLCFKCNMALGFIGDSEDIALAMAAYLRKHRKLNDQPKKA